MSKFRKLPSSFLAIAVIFVFCAGASYSYGDVKIKEVSWAGSGCSASQKADAKLDGDTRLTLKIPDFEAKSAGKSGSLRDMRKNCGVLLELDYPKDREFRVTAATLGVEGKGRALDALLRIDQKFQGETTVLFQDYEVKGDKALARPEIKLGQTVWSKCGERKPLMLQFAARLNKMPTDADKESTALSVKGPVDLTLEWRSCK